LIRVLAKLSKINVKMDNISVGLVRLLIFIFNIYIYLN